MWPSKALRNNTTDAALWCSHHSNGRTKKDEHTTKAKTIQIMNTAAAAAAVVANFNVHLSQCCNGFNKCTLQQQQQIQQRRQQQHEPRHRKFHSMSVRKRILHASTRTMVKL